MSTGARLSEVHVVFHKGLRTGGPEAIHQLVRAIGATTGRAAFVVPHPHTAHADPVTEFDTYECRETALAPGEHPGTLVVPEIYPAMALESSYARRAVWWLSVDNSPAFYTVRGWFNERHGPRHWRDLLHVLVRVARAARLRRRLRGDQELVHLFQSNYARLTVLRRLGKQGHMLSDYVAAPPPPAQRTGSRQGIAYNPAKGGATVERLRPLLPDVAFLPLEDMSPSDVAQALASSAIYLDAGHHPGKDRLPREACLSGCAVLVARQGSGANRQDVPIPQDHTFGIDGGPQPIADLVRWALDHVDDVVRMQQPYRRQIASERATFEQEVRRVFGGDANL